MEVLVEVADFQELAESVVYDLDGHGRRIYPGKTHTWNCWRRALYDFAQVVFR